MTLLHDDICATRQGKPCNCPSAACSESALNDLLCGFEEWLRSVCFQKPTTEAYDLAKSAWLEAAKRNNTEYAETQFNKASKKMGW